MKRIIIFNYTFIFKICAPLWKNMIPLRRSGFVHPTGICFNVDKSLDVDTVTTQMFKADKLNKTIRINRNDLTYEMAEIGFAISPKKVGCIDMSLRFIQALILV